MNKQKGFLRMKGSIGETTFVKTKDGFRAQEKLEVQPEDLKKILLFEGPVKMRLNLEGPEWQQNSSELR